MEVWVSGAVGDLPGVKAAGGAVLGLGKLSATICRQQKAAPLSDGAPACHNAFVMLLLCCSRMTTYQLRHLLCCCCFVGLYMCLHRWQVPATHPVPCW
jgi:hypothetical protein